jgi:hypothetical protein
MVHTTTKPAMVAKAISLWKGVSFNDRANSD